MKRRELFNSREEALDYFSSKTLFKEVTKTTIEDYVQFVNYWIAMEEECFELVLEGIKEFQSEN